MSDENKIVPMPAPVGSFVPKLDQVLGASVLELANLSEKDLRKLQIDCHASVNLLQLALQYKAGREQLWEAGKGESK